MNHRSKGFTLIELLVVIAIIAILAAILFPVFAQAKAAAKSTKTVSNLKQIGNAFQLYLGDYDDTYSQAGTMNGNGASWGTGACNGSVGCPNWDSLLMPYTKSFDIFESDFDRVPRTFSPFGGDKKRSFRVAANVVNGWAGVNTWDGGDYGFTPLNATAVPAPASTILVTEQRNSGSGCNWWIGAAFWECGVWQSRSSNTLANDDPVAYGTSTGLDRYASGIDFANANRANYLFTDSHAKSFAKGYLFPGYLQKKDSGSPIDPNLRGVCLDAGPFGRSASDCPIPQQ